jgi:hypothetical protein
LAADLDQRLARLAKEIEQLTPKERHAAAQMLQRDKERRDKQIDRQERRRGSLTPPEPAFARTNPACRLPPYPRFPLSPEYDPGITRELARQARWGTGTWADILFLEQISPASP